MTRQEMDTNQGERLLKKLKNIFPRKAVLLRVEGFIGLNPEDRTHKTRLKGFAMNGNTLKVTLEKETFTLIGKVVTYKNGADFEARIKFEAEEGKTVTITLR